MAAFRYERVTDPDTSLSVDQVSVYNPEQIDDTAIIINRPSNFDSTFAESITLKDIFQDIQLSTRQQRICMTITFSAAGLTLLLMISLFAGFGKVLFDVIAHQEKLRHGLMMVPSLQKRPINIFYFNIRNGTANKEYVTEIDNYLKKYDNYQQSMKKYLTKCSVEEISRGNQRWCMFDFQEQFGSECSKATNYGYDDGNPCILFIFENRLGWKPNMKVNAAYLPFSCRMHYQYSSNVYANLTYYPALPTAMRNGGFQMNLLPNQKITDESGNEISGEDGDVLYSLPPMVIMKMTFWNVVPSRGSNNIGPFTLDCRIKDNVAGYQFDNINDFKGQTIISFDVVPQYA